MFRLPSFLRRRQLSGRAARSRRPQIALLIDFENCAIPRSVNLVDVVATFEQRGRLAVRRAIAKWSSIGPRSISRLNEAAIEMVSLNTLGPAGKNSTDIQLAVEAMELAYAQPAIDTYVLAAGDSDYIPLVTRLRALGKHVVLIADQRHGSQELIRFCDEFIPVAAWSRPTENNAVACGSGPLEGHDFALLKRCITTVVKDSPIYSAELKALLMRLDPSFQEREYGCRRFNEYLVAAEQAHVVRLSARKTGGFTVRGA